MVNPGADSPDPPVAGSEPAPDARTGLDTIGLPDHPRLTRARAIAEVVLCSSYPTQIAAAGVLAAAGVSSRADDGGLSAGFVFGVSMLDAIFVVGLIVYLLRRSGEPLAGVFVGTRPPWREAVLGIALMPIVTVGVAALVVIARAALPALHNVPTNPLTAFMTDPATAAIFALVVVLAGGVREELQRAFQLHRLTNHVCPPGVALALTSVAFGLGHTMQGRDVALATFGLGIFWGVMYIRRRSMVASAVSHGLFNLGQIALALAASPSGPL